MPETTPRAHIIGVSRDAPLQHHHYVQGYLYACEAEGKSPATVASYAENLGRFQALARELGLPSNPHEITRQHVRMFLAHRTAWAIHQPPSTIAWPSFVCGSSG